MNHVIVEATNSERNDTIDRVIVIQFGVYVHSNVRMFRINTQSFRIASSNIFVIHNLLMDNISVNSISTDMLY